MPRKPKVKIQLNDINSLQSLCEDIYHDLYTQRTQVINDLNRMINQVELEDDHSIYQVYKTRASLLGSLTTNSSTKLLLAKLLSSTIDSYQRSEEKDNEGVTLAQMKYLRNLVQKSKSTGNG